MIRSDFDISDEDFDKMNKPFEEAIDNYVKNNFIDEYMAYYIASGYNMSALFEGSLNGVFNAAIDDLCSIQYGSKEDIEKLKQLLKEKYNLILRSDTRLEIEEIKRTDN
nr:hypothetical protein [Bacilli bacterium]